MTGERRPEARGGNVAIIFAVASIALIGTIGMAIDYSRLAVARTELQGRLDAALQAAVRQSSPPRIESAETFFDNNATGSITKVASRHFESDGAALSGTATAVVPTTLSSILGFKSFDVSASGKATAASVGVACLQVDPATANTALPGHSKEENRAIVCERPGRPNPGGKNAAAILQEPRSAPDQL